MKRTHNNLTENKFRAIEKGDPGEGGGGATPLPLHLPLPPPFPGAKIFFRRKTGKQNFYM